MMEQSIDLEQGQPEFSEDELDSIKIGEELAAEEQEMLAGKFKDAEELEKAYIELQRKLGQPNESEEAEEELRETEATEEVEEEPSPEEYTTQQWITDASAEYYENGGLSEETMAQISEMDPQELVDAYVEMQNQATPDLSDSDTAAIKQIAGGDEGYTQMMEWAADTMPAEYVNAFDNLCSTGDAYSIQLAVAGMRAAYEQQNGYEGRMLTGGAPESRPDTFRSQAEVIEAMNDPRYDADPAYRQDVFNKLERSNLQF